MNFKHEHSWHLGQLHHNWEFQKGSPRTSREAFGGDLDAGYRRADAWVFWFVILSTAAVSIYLQVQP